LKTATIYKYCTIFTNLGSRNTFITIIYHIFYTLTLICYFIVCFIYCTENTCLRDTVIICVIKWHIATIGYTIIKANTDIIVSQFLQSRWNQGTLQNRSQKLIILYINLTNLKCFLKYSNLSRCHSLIWINKLLQ
jgi:hypothetical protein